MATSFEPATNWGSTDSDRKDVHVVYEHPEFTTTNTHIVLKFQPWTVVGRYLIIYTPSVDGESDRIALCEVKVYGFKGIQSYTLL